MSIMGALSTPLRAVITAGIIAFVATGLSYAAPQASSASTVHAELSEASSTGAHKVYIAVATSKHRTNEARALSDSYIRSLVAEASRLWKRETGGKVSSFAVAEIVRYTSSIVCYGLPINRDRWLNEASKKFTSSSRTSYFGSQTKRHLLVLTPDESDESCANTEVDRPGEPYLAYSTLGSGLSDGGSAHIYANELVTPRQIVHGLGRNIGFNYANMHFCRSSSHLEGTTFPASAPPSPRCTSSYGQDSSDLMGLPTWAKPEGSVSIPTLFIRGILTKTQVPLLSSDGITSKSWTYDLTALGLRKNIQGLRVLDPISGDTYWIEYRSPVGRDAEVDSLSEESTLWSWHADDDVTSGGGYRWYFGPGVKVLKQDLTNATSPASLSLTTLRRYGTTGLRASTMSAGDGFMSASGGVLVDVNWTDLETASVTVTVQSTPKLSPPPITSIIEPEDSGWYADVSPREFRLLGVTYSYQWFVDGEPIPGTDSSRLMSPFTGRPVYAEVTAHKDGFIDGVSRTQTIIGDQPILQPPPHMILPAEGSVAGKPIPVRILVDKDREYASGGTVRVELLKDGVVVSSTTSTIVDFRGNASAVLPAPQAAGTYSIRAIRAEHQVPEESLTVAKMTPKIIVNNATRSAHSLSVTVTGLASAPPTGRIEVQLNNRVLGVANLMQSANGSVRIPLATSAGSLKLLRVVYFGDANHTTQSYAPARD